MEGLASAGTTTSTCKTNCKERSKSKPSATTHDSRNLMLLRIPNVRSPRFRIAMQDLSFGFDGLTEHLIASLRSVFRAFFNEMLLYDYLWLGWSNRVNISACANVIKFCPGVLALLIRMFCIPILRRFVRAVSPKRVLVVYTYLRIHRSSIFTSPSGSFPSTIFGGDAGGVTFSTRYPFSGTK